MATPIHLDHDAPTRPTTLYIPDSTDDPTPEDLDALWLASVGTVADTHFRGFDPSYLTASFGLGVRAILWRIILPAASPYVVTGLRIALSIALILVTTAEMVAGSSGLGFFILDEERSMNSRNMYAGILLVAALGYALNRSFLAAERRAMQWRQSQLSREPA